MNHFRHLDFFYPNRSLTHGKLQCKFGYSAPSSDLLCLDGVWTIGNTSRPLNNQTCVAQCEGGCLHGICSSPNFCECDPDYFGTSCQFKTCSFDPPEIPFGSFNGRFVDSLNNSFTVFNKKSLFSCKKVIILLYKKKTFKSVFLQYLKIMIQLY